MAYPQTNVGTPYTPSNAGKWGGEQARNWSQPSQRPTPMAAPQNTSPGVQGTPPSPLNGEGKTGSSSSSMHSAFGDFMQSMGGLFKSFDQQAPVGAQQAAPAGGGQEGRSTAAPLPGTPNGAPPPQYPVAAQPSPVSAHAQGVVAATKPPPPVMGAPSDPTGRTKGQTADQGATGGVDRTGRTKGQTIEQGFTGLLTGLEALDTSQPTGDTSGTTTGDVATDTETRKDYSSHISDSDSSAWTSGADLFRSSNSSRDIVKARMDNDYGVGAGDAYGAAFDKVYRAGGSTEDARRAGRIAVNEFLNQPPPEAPKTEEQLAADEAAKAEAENQRRMDFANNWADAQYKAQAPVRNRQYDQERARVVEAFGEGSSQVANFDLNRRMADDDFRGNLVKEGMGFQLQIDSLTQDQQRLDQAAQALKSQLQLNDLQMQQMRKNMEDPKWWEYALGIIGNAAGGLAGGFGGGAGAMLAKSAFAAPSGQQSNEDAGMGAYSNEFKNPMRPYD